MGLVRDEFFRLLPGAVRDYEMDGDTVRWSEGGRSGTIRLVRLEARRLASLDLPRLGVEIALEKCSEPEGEAFLLRFLRAFLRGGG